MNADHLSSSVEELRELLLATQRHLELAAQQTNELAATIDSKREQVKNKDRQIRQLLQSSCSHPGDNHRQLQRQMCRTQQLAQRSPAEQLDHRRPKKARANGKRKPVVDLALSVRPAYLIPANSRFD